MTLLLATERTTVVEVDLAPVITDRSGEWSWAAQIKSPGHATINLEVDDSDWVADGIIRFVADVAATTGLAWQRGKLGTWAEGPGIGPITPIKDDVVVEESTADAPS